MHGQRSSKVGRGEACFVGQGAAVHHAVHVKTVCAYGCVRECVSVCARSLSCNTYPNHLKLILEISGLVELVGLVGLIGLVGW